MNVTALVNTSGTVVERYLYDPYGKVTITDANWSVITWANSKKNEILYCGYRWDPESGLYHTPYRPYHPTLGRWSQPDEDYYDDLNLSQYVGSNPLNLTDPSGLAAAPGGSAEGTKPGAACCCTTDACTIEITLKMGPASATWAPDPEVRPNPNYRAGQPVNPQPATVNVPVFVVEAGVNAEVKITQAQGKDVTGCHLRQDAEGASNWDMSKKFPDMQKYLQVTGRMAKITPVAKPGFAFAVEKDYSSGYFSKKVVDPKAKAAVAATYGGWWLKDNPNVLDKFDVPPASLSYWFQAHVYVEENPKVENWYGFSASFDTKAQTAQPNSWKDEQKQKPDFGKK